MNPDPLDFKVLAPQTGISAVYCLRALLKQQRKYLATCNTDK